MSMESTAAEAMGEAVSMTTVVSPKGQGKTMMAAGMARQVSGLTGSLGVEQLARSKRTDTPGGYKGGYMVLALGETKLGFFEMKRGLLSNKAGQLLEEVARAEVLTFELGGGTLTSALTVALEDGTSWELEVPRAHKGKTERMAAALRA